jgi:hypothetical protein
MVYVDYFTTVCSVDNASDPVITADNWESLVDHGHENVLDPDMSKFMFNLLTKIGSLFQTTVEGHHLVTRGR